MDGHRGLQHGRRAHRAESPQPVVLGARDLHRAGTCSREKRRRLASRREQARQSVSRYFEEVTFRVSKDVQDALRRIHRGLRSSFRGECRRDHAVGHRSGPGRQQARVSPADPVALDAEARVAAAAHHASRGRPRLIDGLALVSDSSKTRGPVAWYGRRMTIRFNVIGVVVADMGRSLRVLSPARARASRLGGRPTACRGRPARRSEPRLRHDRDHPLVRPELVATVGRASHGSRVPVRQP